MGIHHLWELTGEGKSRSIAAWSSDHFKATGRPLRIVVDEANWRYKSLSDAQDAMIKKNCLGSNVREKDILERIKNLLTLNVQLVFIFDGPTKKGKKDGVVGMVHQDRVQLLKQLLDHLGVPRLQAPGDAEAECVRLHSLKGDLYQEQAHGRLLRYDDCARTYGLSQKGILLFGLLVGNDFDLRGLYGCGKEMALKLARQESLATALPSISTEQELQRWRSQLATAIFKLDRNFAWEKLKVFPLLKVLIVCQRPTVSTDVILSQNKLEEKGWSRPFQLEPTRMANLFDFFIDHFHATKNVNFPAQYIVPLEINNRLRRTPSHQKHANNDLALSLVNKLDGGLTTIVRVQDPLSVLPELGHVCGKKFNRIKGKGEESLVFEPIEFELLSCVLEHGLSETARTAKLQEGKRKSKATKKSAREGQPANMKNPTKTSQASGQTAPKQIARPRHDLMPQRKRKALDMEDLNNDYQPRTKKQHPSNVDKGVNAMSETLKPTSTFKTGSLPSDDDENEEPNGWEMDDVSLLNSSAPRGYDVAQAFINSASGSLECLSTSSDQTLLLGTSKKLAQPTEQSFWVSQRNITRPDVSDEEKSPDLEDLFRRAEVLRSAKRTRSSPLQPSRDSPDPYATIYTRTVGKASMVNHAAPSASATGGSRGDPIELEYHGGIGDVFPEPSPLADKDASTIADPAFFRKISAADAPLCRNLTRL